MKVNVIVENVSLLGPHPKSLIARIIAYLGDGRSAHSLRVLQRNAQSIVCKGMRIEGILE